MPRWRAFVLSLTLAFGSLACATYSDKTSAMREHVQVGELTQGLTELNRFLKVKDAHELPSKWGSETALAVLERATLLHATQDWDASAINFQAAEQELELLDIAKDTAGEIGKYMFSDSATKYKTTPTEKLSLNAINLLNYLNQGDLDGARIEGKRFTVMRNYLLDYDPDNAHGAFGSYLSGFVAEREGNWDEALRFYDEALERHDLPGLGEAIQRVARKGSYRTERLNRYIGVPSLPAPVQGSVEPPAGEAIPVPAPAPVAPQTQGGEVLLVVMTGRVPYKVPRRIPIGAAIGLAGAYVTGDTRVLEHTALKVVVFPDLEPAGNLFDSVAWSIDGRPIHIDLVSDLGVEITHEFEQLKPKIIGSAITRMIVRAAAAEGARAAGETANGAVGLLSALAVEATLVVIDKPDTRSWTLLPDRVFIGRAMVPPGEHGVEVFVQGNGGQETRTMQVNVAEGGYVVLDVTTLR